MYTRHGFGQISTLTSAIIKQEGTCPSPSACSNNNPGNLMYAGQPGATPGPGGLAVFDSYQSGYNALINQLTLYANGTCGACNGQPQTIAGTFGIYAPFGHGTNNPTIYANNVAAALGVDPNTPLSTILTAQTPGGITPPGFTVPDFSTGFPALDLSSIGLPDLSSIDPTVLMVGALVLGVAVLMVLKK